MRAVGVELGAWAPRALALGLALGLGAAASSGCWSPNDRREAAARNLYDRHCGRCHGLSKTGPTPVAGLDYEPADLRQLYESYGTPLDHDRLAAYIDGRHVRPGERSEDMPVWGDELYAYLPDDAALEELREGAIDLVIEYLQTIQANAPDHG
ncbi:MAG TPA: c-type cytochrome [Myxococcota bacterium]|nr:c-type cytochrome [Myxococcota bacterium]